MQTFGSLSSAANKDMMSLPAISPFPTMFSKAAVQC